MPRKRIYMNDAEKQKAFRMRHGQKRKVSFVIRRGEPLGSQETTFRERKPGESWGEFGKYLKKAVKSGRKREASLGATKYSETHEEERKKGALPEEIYVLRRKYEEDLEELMKTGGVVRHKAEPPKKREE